MSPACRNLILPAQLALAGDSSVDAASVHPVVAIRLAPGRKGGLLNTQVALNKPTVGLTHVIGSHHGTDRSRFKRDGCGQESLRCDCRVLASEDLDISQESAQGVVPAILRGFDAVATDTRDFHHPLIEATLFGKEGRVRRELLGAVPNVKLVLSRRLIAAGCSPLGEDESQDCQCSGDETRNNGGEPCARGDFLPVHVETISRGEGAASPSLQVVAW